MFAEHDLSRPYETRRVLRRPPGGGSGTRGKRLTPEAAGLKARRYKNNSEGKCHGLSQRLFYFGVVEVGAVKLGDAHFAFADFDGRGSGGAVG